MFPAAAPRQIGQPFGLEETHNCIQLPVKPFCIQMRHLLAPNELRWIGKMRFAPACAQVSAEICHDLMIFHETRRRKESHFSSASSRRRNRVSPEINRV